VAVVAEASRPSQFPSNSGGYGSGSGGSGSELNEFTSMNNDQVTVK
jgi:hypothetical protein